jgi:hypothetical protein
MTNTTATRPDDWPNWGDTGDKTRPPTDAYIAAGWPQSLTAPPRQYWNWAFNQCFDGIRYVLQRGIGGWSGTETYNTNAIVERGGLQYRALLASGPSSPQDPSSAPTYWELLTLSAAQIAAVGFDTVTARNTAITSALSPYVSNGALTTALASYVTGAQLTTAVQAAIATAKPNNAPPGFLGTFGSGRWRVFLATESWACPAASIRIRTVPAGGGGRTAGSGGGGGEYAIGVFVVSVGASVLVTVGAAGVGGANPGAGGASSVGALISALGGAAGTVAAGAAGGSGGSGGDERFAGGAAGTFVGSGGGAAGSQLGAGGKSGASISGGAGVGGGNSTTSSGGSPFGAGGVDSIGNPPPTVAPYSGVNNPTSSLLRFPFDGFGGGGGRGGFAATNGDGGNGAGGGAGPLTGTGTGGTGGIGGGGGGNNAAGGSSGTGGLGGGGGGGGNGGNGGGGVVIIEW